MKKILLILLLAFIAGKSFGQSGYSLPLPEKWKSETIPFPIDFAPSIHYSGIEELRFTPGWGDAKSNEYWAYTFLWFVDGSPTVTTDSLNTQLTAYFTGLYRSNVKTPPSGDNFTKVQLQTTSTAGGDEETYSGTISTLNFLTSKPISFLVTIHVQRYPDDKQSAIFFEISPKPYNNPVWQELDGIVQGFQLQK
jgi:hypothetical protein